MTPGYLILAAAALATLGAAALAYRVEHRARRWNHRRALLLAERRRRHDQAYGDELARARTMLRPSFPASREHVRDRYGRPFWLVPDTDHYSRKVKP